jgi:hypothetical protein
MKLFLFVRRRFKSEISLEDPHVLKIDLSYTGPAERFGSALKP